MQLSGLGLFATYAPGYGDNVAWMNSLAPDARAAYDRYLAASVARTNFEGLRYSSPGRTTEAMARRAWAAVGGQAGYDRALNELQTKYPEVWAYSQGHPQKTGGLGQGGDIIAAIAAVAIAGAAAGGSSGGGAAAAGGGEAATTGAATTGATTAGTTTAGTTTAGITTGEAVSTGGAVAGAVGGGGGENKAPAQSPPQTDLPSSIPGSGMLNTILPDSMKEAAGVAYGYYVDSQGNRITDEQGQPIPAVSPNMAAPTGIQATLKKWGIPAALAAFWLLK